MSDDFEYKKKKTSSWFLTLREEIIKSFEYIEDIYQVEQASEKPVGRFTVKRTKRSTTLEPDGGGGIMAIMRGGNVFEKVGVNVSTVYGPLDARIKKLMKTRKKITESDREVNFWASGISVVAHMQNPHCPAVHMNTRMFWTPDSWWFGGGTDLNPSMKKAEDTKLFHTYIKECCDRHDKKYYLKYKKWADEYFYIPHRNMARGVGGIFFDDLNTDWDKNFSFIQDVGTTFLKAFTEILKRRMSENWTAADKNIQLKYRGLYSEYNLIYDRGTKFGLESGHDPNAVLMSLPPLVRWD